jgi:HPt (histidine-containing phosphotransfer) domain-containing protein
MPNSANSVQAQLDALRQAFGAKLAERIEEIETAAVPVRDGSGDDDVARAFDVLLALAHKLGGSAGTLGYHDVGDIAQRLEGHCADVLERNAAPTMDERKDALDLVAHLSKQL